METVEELKEYLTDRGYEDTVVLKSPDYVDAVVGVTTDGQVVYEWSKMVEHLVSKDGMSPEEAEEFISYNTVRALPYMGDKHPVIMFGEDML